MVYSHRRSKDDLLLILYYIGCCSPWGRKELDTTEQLIWADIGWWIQLAVQEADIHNDTHLSTRSFLSPILSFATCNVLSWTLFSILLHFLNFFFSKKNRCFIYLFYFWLCWVFIAGRGLSLVSVSGGLLASCCVWASHCGSFSCWEAHGLSCPMPCGISWTREWPHVPCIGKWILNHWATREVLKKKVLML